MGAQALNTTLCYLERQDAYLMLHRTKKQGDVNHDKWIGVGGKFEPGESPEECLLREVREETGLTLTRYRLRGILTFVCPPWPDEYIFLYTADQWEGSPIPCSEGDLQWVEKSRLYELPLWQGDHIFLDLLARDHPFFSLKLVYEGDFLRQAILDGHVLNRKQNMDFSTILTPQKGAGSV